MVLEPILCPTYGGDDVVKHGQLCEGSHRPQLPTVLTKVDLSRCLLRRAIALLLSLICDRWVLEREKTLRLWRCGWCLGAQHRQLRDSTERETALAL